MRAVTVPNISRRLVPAERLEMLFYNGDVEYWRRAVRTVYTDDGRYEWDPLDKISWMNVKKGADCQRLTIEIPDWIRDIFERNLEAYLQEQHPKSTEVGVGRETENRLENLGYKM